MATKKRAGLGRGLSALIPQAPVENDRAIDVFFDGSAPSGRRIESTQIDVADVEEIAVQRPEVTPEKASPKRTRATKTRVEESTQIDDKSAAEAPEPAADVDPRAETADEMPAHDAADVDTSDRTAETQRTADTQDTDETQNTDDPIEGLLPVPGATLQTLDPQRIVPNTRQPRSEFDQEALDELIHSVREFGVLQPIVVRRLRDGDPRLEVGDFELIMGERRLRATKASGRTEIPAIIRDTDDDDMLRDALLENLHRADLNPLEEASAYRQLLDDFGCTQEVLASRIGRSRPRISNTLRLLNLPVDVQRKVAAGVLSAGHARAILSVGEPAAMTQLADKIINEDLSVRDAEAAASRSASRAGRPSGEPRESGSSLSAYLDEVGERLGDRLNTRVKVTLRKTKGQITVDFASVADLHRILAELGDESAPNH